MVRTVERSSQKRRADRSPDAAYWDAVRNRDRSFDGTFYYAVATTGVYCRPSCAARLAKRENVTFHASCEAAKTAGFRPCKRCKPNEASLHDIRGQGG